MAGGCSEVASRMHWSRALVVRETEADGGRRPCRKPWLRCLLLQVGAGRPVDPAAGRSVSVRCTLCASFKNRCSKPLVAAVLLHDLQLGPTCRLPHLEILSRERGSSSPLFAIARRILSAYFLCKEHKTTLESSNALCTERQRERPVDTPQA